ncbi:MAG: exodeoxyribonuclease V subunit gamma [Nocardioidaceae bacterium]
MTTKAVATTTPSSLHLHRSERADALVEALAGVLAHAQVDAFAREVVAVPARGVERWVTQRLSHHLGVTAGADGVCANVDFPSPRSLVAESIAAASGVDPDQDPWAAGRLSWTLLEVIDECAPEPWCSALGRHLVLDGQPRRDRRFTAAQHLARLFGSYAEQRPAMLREWAAGTDSDGTDKPVPADLAWQAELWRRLRARIDNPSPAERLPDACAGLRRDATLVELPERISFFGPTRLTTEQVEVVAALAQHRDVHLWLPHPSAALWDAIAATEPSTGVTGRPRRRADPTAALVQHRLLASLGRDAREMQLVTTGIDADLTDQHHPVQAPLETLLGRLQSDLVADRAPQPTYDLLPADRSLQVHACYGRARQVEVLREALLNLLAADPTLEPRDVLVMCPDIETYAPLISATFGLADTERPASHPGHRLRVRLADRSLRQTNPLLDTVARLLELADARVTASQVLDLVSLPPVRRRFRLDDEQLERIGEWVSSSGVRWGLDAGHRAAYKMDGVGQNTWQAGLDRLLLGVTMPEDDLQWLELALPLDDVDSSDVDLTGRLAELVDRLGTVLDDLTGEHPLRHWHDTLGYALDLLTDVAEPDAWQLAQARRELGDVATGAGDRVDTVQLTLADVRALLADRLQGRPTRANFRTGNLTMCSMVPMRSVPHRVICLLGLDDGVFPRTAGTDGDDVLARDPLVGERDRRSEDRQLLLDAMLAAEEHLVVLYTGADERTGAERPPAVPLGEILDVVDATVRSPGGRPAHQHVVIRHPLQPFDARNFEHAVLGAAGPFSHDRGALAGAEAATRPRRPVPPLLASPLPPMADHDGVVPLDRLVRFLEHPVRGFLSQRLGIGVPEEDEPLDDALHAELPPLDEWAIGNRWLEGRLAGADPVTAQRAEWLRGTLPPGALGNALLEQIVAEAEPVLAVGEPDRVGEGHSYDVSVPLPDGRVLAGTVNSVHADTLARTVYSRLGAKHRLRAWVLLLALAASHPDRGWRATTVGRGAKRGKPPQRSLLAAPPRDDAVAVLGTLVDLRDRGLCEPLPLPLDAAHSYAHSRHLHDHEQAVLDELTKKWPEAFEAKDDWHVRLWGAQSSFADVSAARAGDADQRNGATERETARFGALACRLWWPLLDAETLESA